MRPIPLWLRLQFNSWPTCHFAYEIGKLIQRQKDTKCKLHFAYGAKCLCVFWPTDMYSLGIDVIICCMGSFN
jgi:hypothetical protein